MICNTIQEAINKPSKVLKHTTSISKKYTFLRGTKARSPTKLLTERKAVIQPSPGSLVLPGAFPSVSTPACSYVFLLKPNKYDPKPPAQQKL